MSEIMLLTGDSVEKMKELDDNSIDAIVCDPPYGLKFMSRKWDYDVPSVELWAEALRVLKPGGHLLAFSGSRTYHRMVVNIEDAGFDIRDQIMWIYGSGFPKSMNVAKAIESQITLGKSNTRSLKETEQSGDGESYTIRGRNNGLMGEERVFDRKTYTPQGEAADWNGWGTALKPAHEPIVVARKPIPTTVAKNVLEYGTGGLHIDACRVGDEEISVHNAPKGTFAGGEPDRGSETIYRTHAGRWPANVILSHHVECVEKGMKKVKGTPREARKSESTKFGGVFGEGGVATGQAGHADADGLETIEDWGCHPECPFVGFPDAKGRIGMNKYSGANQIYGEFKVSDQSFSTAGKSDGGTAARFFYCAKASKKERNHGLGDLPDVVKAAAFQNRVCGLCNKHELDSSLDRRCVCDTPQWEAGRLTPTKNSHPTVKPIALMKYLCKLVTPPGGVILDPFMGSGTTGIAAVGEGFDFIGIDLDEEYVDLSRVRINVALNELQESITVPQDDTATE